MASLDNVDVNIASFGTHPLPGKKENIEKAIKQVKAEEPVKQLFVITSHILEDIVDDINSYLNNGYSLHGSMFSSSHNNVTYFHQPLLK